MQVEHARSADGTRITFDRQGSGPPLLLVHGALGDRRVSWTHLRPLLEECFTVYALDRRGHGDSDPYLPGHTLEREFEDVLAVARCIGDDVSVAGHSYGAVCVLGAALDRSCISRVLAYDPPGLGDDAAAQNALSRRMLDAARAAEGHLESSDSSAALRTWLAGLGVSDERLDEMALSSDWNRAAEMAARSIVPETRALYSRALDVELFASLALPVEVISTGDSYSRLQAAVPHLTVRRVDAGHDAHRTDPELIAGIIITFFGGGEDR